MLPVKTSEQSDVMRDRTTQMNIDHQALFAPITKQTVRADAATIESLIDEAVRAACAEVPGPVHIGLPSDLADQKAAAAPPLGEPPGTPALAKPDRLAAAAETIGQAQRPLLAVGLTALRLGLGPQVLRLAEKLQAPLVLTPMAKGLVPEDHPLYAGVLFHARSDLMAEVIREADLVVGIGYDPVEFNYESWLPEVALVHLDTRPADVDVSVSLAVNVVGDLAATLEALAPLYRGADARLEIPAPARAAVQRARALVARHVEQRRCFRRKLAGDLRHVVDRQQRKPGVPVEAAAAEGLDQVVQNLKAGHRVSMIALLRKPRAVS